MPLDNWWTFAGVENEQLEHKLSTNDGLAITRAGNKLSVLNIESAKGRHRGNYTCFSKNRAGIAQYSAQLAINGDLF